MHGGEHRGYVLSQVDIIHTDDGDISADLFFVFVKGFDGTNSSQIICTKNSCEIGTAVQKLLGTFVSTVCGLDHVSCIVNRKIYIMQG